MPRLVGPTIAKELIFTARTFTSAEAYRWQLLNRYAWSCSLRNERAWC